MKIIQPNSVNNVALPLQLNISFHKVFALYEKYASEAFKDHPKHIASKEMVATIKEYPDLINGFSDLSLLDSYKEPINALLDPLFPESLLENEIKAATIPFSFTSFKFTNRLSSILENANIDYEFNIRNFEENAMYIMACTFILKATYGYDVDLKRPFFFDIPDTKIGITKHYRATFNSDFSEISSTENAPKITEKDFKELLDNFENIAIWKEKFPPNSYVFKGFGILNLFDVTADETLSSIKANLLRSDENLIEDVQQNLREFYAIKDLKLGYSIFDSVDSKISESSASASKLTSLILNENAEINCNNYFCEKMFEKVFKRHEIFTISDVENYGKATQQNSFYKDLHQSGIQSILIIPIKVSNSEDLALLEIASPRPYELNSVNVNKLIDIIPVFQAAVKRSSEEHQNILEAIIQQHYTSIHPTVKWRFHKAAKNYHANLESKNKKIQLEEIVFNNVFPLYGQSDIKGSSDARNVAIKQDLITQLSLAIDVLNNSCKTEKLPIYKELMFRVNQYLIDVKKGLNAGDEIGILDFLKQEIYPVFKHIKSINKVLNEQVDIYVNRLDPDLEVVYEKRKDYEDSVTLLNEKLVNFIDKKQVEAQQMYPHFFERYKTDGVEFNMYIGESLVKNKPFDKLYLYNLRLWQLQTMWGMENIAFSSREEMHNKLRVASLILVHSNSLSIKFRMDEKQFDVDGAYNIRYEIIKKRIDKACIKDTQERLTVPGKIAIVYSQDKDALEYIKYIKYLQAKNLLGKIEMLHIEDLQGVSGLKALRVEVIYHKDFNEENAITFSDLIQVVEG
jgi:hypothetical protein